MAEKEQDGPQVGTRYSGAEIHENILEVALMAWLLSSTRETLAQIALIRLTTAPIAAFEFKHSIAGAVEMFYRVWIGDISLASGFASFELPALAGNIIGGVVLVALVNHGQAGGGNSRSARPRAHQEDA